ncbi:Reticulon-3 [Orchesella cincta]|uniref:Reticulon-like protein n=1 Tax=Orchesella cincta TaxID=48709 RepID=A0A1D2NGN0_ORCCI|nr:Reticulon-3 [Orchesella cincta]
MGRKNRRESGAGGDPEIIYDDGPVGELVYWRDPKKSGVVFGSIFVVLLALTLLSLISVVAYTSLAVLSGAFAFRVYKSVLQAVQKTQDGHPFKEYLDLDIAIPSEKAQELSNAIINYFNNAVVQLRRLFLVEDLVDSAKFGVVLYLLTYIGGWFNGLTLLILGFVALFSLPKVYETNKTVIDQYIELINSKISEVNAKVTAAVPFLKKEKAQ